MKPRLQQLMQVVFYPPHLKRTGWIALVVGTWLTAFNQGDLIIQGDWTLILGGKVVLNYLTPFVVANLGLIARTMPAETPVHETPRRQTTVRRKQ